VYDPETRQNVSYSKMLEEEVAIEETSSHRASRTRQEDGTEIASIDRPEV